MQDLVRHVSAMLTPYTEEAWKLLKQGMQYCEFCGKSFAKVAYHLVHEQLGITDPTAVNLIFAVVFSVWLGLCVVILAVATARESRRPLVNIRDDTAESHAAPPAAESCHSEPSVHSTEPTSVTSAPANGVGRILDFDKFMWRMHSSVVVNKLKANEKKSRCMRISDNCELKLYKLFRVDHGDVSALGSSYLRLPLSELLDCFETDSSRKGADKSIILEFRSKSLQVSGSAGIDTNQLLRGFRHLAGKIKEDRQFLEIWRTRFQNRGGKRHVVATPQKSPSKAPVMKTPDSAQSLASSSSSQQPSYYSFGKKKTKLL